MVTELADQIETFGGNASRIRCFLHVLNLVAKTILAQFDTCKDIGGGDYELRNLARELEEAEIQAIETEETPGKELVEEDEWVDERDDMTDDERATHNDQVRPLKLILAKVRIKRLSPINHGLTFVLASEGRICNHQFIDYSPSTMEGASSRTQAQGTTHAS